VGGVIYDELGGQLLPRIPISEITDTKLSVRTLLVLIIIKFNHLYEIFLSLSYKNISFINREKCGIINIYQSYFFLHETYKFILFYLCSLHNNEKNYRQLFCSF